MEHEKCDTFESINSFANIRTGRFLPKSDIFQEVENLFVSINEGDIRGIQFVSGSYFAYE